MTNLRPMSATDLTCAGCKRPLRESEAWFSWFVRNGQTIAAVVSHHYGDCMPGRSRQADWSPDHSERWERWIFPDVQAGDDLRDHTLHRVWELSGGIYAWAVDERATDEVVRDVLRQLSPVLQLAELGSARRHAGKRRRA